MDEHRPTWDEVLSGITAPHAASWNDVLSAPPSEADDTARDDTALDDTGRDDTGGSNGVADGGRAAGSRAGESTAGRSRADGGRAGGSSRASASSSEAGDGDLSSAGRAAGRADIAQQWASVLDDLAAGGGGRSESSAGPSGAGVVDPDRDRDRRGRRRSGGENTWRRTPDSVDGHETTDIPTRRHGASGAAPRGGAPRESAAEPPRRRTASEAGSATSRQSEAGSPTSRQSEAGSVGDRQAEAGSVGGRQFGAGARGESRSGSARGRREAGTGSARTQREPAGTGDPREVAREICLRQLAVRPRTRAELAAAMRRRGVEEDVAAEVLERYDEVGIIDDAAFAKAWVSSRHHSKGLARRALAVELRRKGVGDDEVGEALGELDVGTEEATARALVDRKLRGSGSAAPEALFRRLVGMLARKGYPPSVAVRVVKDALAERDDLGEFIDGVDTDALIQPED